MRHSLKSDSAQRQNNSKSHNQNYSSGPNRDNSDDHDFVSLQSWHWKRVELIVGIAWHFSNESFCNRFDILLMTMVAVLVVILCPSMNIKQEQQQQQQKSEEQKVNV